MISSSWTVLIQPEIDTKRASGSDTLVPSGSRARPCLWVALFLTVALLGWLWPIGLGGRMPVGGDATQFSIGLMSELASAIRAGRIPFWNDLWGYGFPGLAESQMGVYYPPHLILFGLLPVEAGTAASLVLHTIWAGLGAAWAARRFGAGNLGAGLAGFAWATCGFFLVHRPHQWGATTASWMPWAWGLAWSTARGESGRRAPLLLAAVLTLQILPGHFQLAFITEVTTLIVGAMGLSGDGVAGTTRKRRTIGMAASMAAVVPLGLAQLAPTAELATLARSQRGVEYLSAFATPPIHLVSYVAPGLFHESPLWRPIAWDAFHAMPEEHLATIGLVPLFLSWTALRLGRRREPAIRGLAIVALTATYLSFGPYAPGFSALCDLPGFSFFRAPARWGSAAMLALAILAGRGLDLLGGIDVPRSGPCLRRFLLVAAAGPALVVGFFELALAATEATAGRPAWPGAAAALDSAFGLLPWKGEPTLSARLAAARAPLDDPRVPIALARQGLPSTDPAARTLTRSRGRIYLRELGPTCVFVAFLLAASFLPERSPRGLAAALVAITLVEAGYWSRQRSFDLGPIRPLSVQSTVLGHLAGLPRGTRSVDPARNLPMIVGAAPLSAYRTLDLPALPALTRLAEAPGGASEIADALRATGSGVRIDPAAGAASLPGWEPAAVVADPALLGWLYGADWVRTLGDRAPSSFLIRRPGAEPARAWFVSAGLGDLGSRGGGPRAVLEALAAALPLTRDSPRPEESTIEVDAPGPGVVVVSQLDYPRWRATLSGRPVPIARVFDGWQGIEVPGPGSWTVRLSYDTTVDRACLAASGLAWVGWALLYWKAKRRGG